MHKIDIVYLWVDGSDKKWCDTKHKWASKIKGKEYKQTNAAGDIRYRDNGELMYSLRSVAECIPWINHIYIITDFNQCPKWLNKRHPKITIVPHRDIIPSDARPTFNSNSIEMCIPNIPGLSEHFLLMNDDFFINKKLSPSFFFTKSGKPRTLYVKRKNPKRNIGYWLDGTDDYRSTIILSAKLIHDIYGKKMYKYSPSHGIDPYLKSTYAQCKKHPMIKPLIDAQIHNKFRTNHELQRWLFTLYNVVHGHGTLRRSRPYKSGHNRIMDTIYNTLYFRSTRRSAYVCARVVGHEKSLKHTATFCINDSVKNTPEMLQANADFLAKRFPNKSEFEK